MCNMFLVTGHGPTGLTLGPYSGKVVAEMMQDKEPGTDISAFAVTRFVPATNIPSPSLPR